MAIHLRTTLAAALALLLPGGLANAALINLDVQTHSTSDANNPSSTIWIDPAADGVPALQNFGDQWNYHTGTTAGSTTALVDTAGAPTGITFGLVNNAAGGTKNNTGLGGSAPFDDVARDELHANGVAGILLELTGLDATGATTYDLYVIGANIWNGGWREVDVTHGGGASNAKLGGPGLNPKYTGGAIQLGLQYQVFAGITADGSGKIAFSVNDWNANTGNAYFSGLQLVTHPVPEPSSLLVLCAGLMGLATKRRS